MRIKQKTRKTFNSDIGITLIALVITVIILLILAGITIGSISGDKDLISQTYTAVEESRGQSVEEAKDLWLIDLETGKEKSLEDLLQELKEKELLNDEEIESILNSEDNSIKIGSREISFYVEEPKDPSIVEADPSLWTYELDPETDNTTAILTGYKGTGRPTEMVIPNYIDGIPIKKVGKTRTGPIPSIWQNTEEGGISEELPKYYNSYQTSIKKIVVSEGIEELTDCALAYSQAAEEIILPSSLKKIGTFAFAYCESLREITIPSCHSKKARNLVRLRAFFISCKPATPAYPTDRFCQTSDCRHNLLL